MTSAMTEFLVTNGKGEFWHRTHNLGVPGGTWVDNTDIAETFLHRQDADELAAVVGGSVLTLAEAEQVPKTPKNTPPAMMGAEPWSCVVAGDSDGETVGYDYIIEDANGDQLATAPNERVMNLMTAAPALVNAVAEMLLAFPADQLDVAQVRARNNAHAAMQLAVDAKRVTPLEPAADNVPDLYRRWLAAQTDVHSSENAAGYYNTVWRLRKERQEKAAEALAAKLLAENPPKEPMRAQWAMIDGRLFLVRWEGNDRDGKKAVLDEQPQPMAYTTQF